MPARTTSRLKRPRYRMPAFVRNVLIDAALAALILTPACAASEPGFAPRDGDIIFHTSRSLQSLAIQRATDSPYSHMGLVYVREGKPFVFEAVDPVKSTPLPEWIARGEGGRFVVKRLADAEAILTPDAIRAMQEVGRELNGRRYDLYFEWSDDRIYCSELVWKVYKRALDLELGGLETIDTFDLSDPVVQEKVLERWGGDPPGDEPVISPAAIFASDKLVTVYEP